MPHVRDPHVGTAVRVLLGVLGVAVVLGLVVVLAGMALSLQVRGHSMAPTLSGGQRVLANPFVDAPDLERFDIITLDPPGPSGMSVKRLVGLPGDHVRIDPDDRDRPVQVRLGGTGPWLAVVNPAWEGWDPRDACCDLAGTDEGAIDPAVVPDGTVWVLGDNIAQSDDSRGYGWVPVDDVSGRVWRRVWPLDRLGTIHTTVTLESIDTP